MVTPVFMNGCFDEYNAAAAARALRLAIYIASLTFTSSICVACVLLDVPSRPAVPAGRVRVLSDLDWSCLVLCLDCNGRQLRAHDEPLPCMCEACALSCPLARSTCVPPISWTNDAQQLRMFCLLLYH